MLLIDITPRDDAFHCPTHPNYIEWWYVDALFVSHYQLAGSFGVWGNLQTSGGCVTRSDFLLATPDGSAVDFSEKVQSSAFHASTDRCEVHLGNSYLRDAGEYYLLHLQKGHDVALDLELTPECSGFGYRHIFDVDKNQHFSWIVPAPRATVQGHLQYGSVHVPLDGVGYHDHNWASVSLTRELRGWKWGRFHGDDSALVFASVEGNDETLFRGMALLERERGVFDYRYLRFGLPTPEVMMEGTPSGWNLAIIDTDIKVQMTLDKISPILQRERAGDYHRFLSRVSGKICSLNHERDISGLMVHELKQLK